MTGAMAGFDGPRDLRNNDARPEFVITDAEKRKAQALILSQRPGDPADVLAMLGVAA